MKYAWVIDYEIYQNVGDTKITGPNGLSQKHFNSLNKGEGQEFQIFDADDILNCIGRIVGEYDGFEPLDDYATPSLGATTIKYKNETGGWKTL